MKLRSGKILQHSYKKMPQELDIKLQSSFNNFKELFKNTIKQGQELLEIIKNSKGLNDRFVIRDKMDEIKNSKNFLQKEEDMFEVIADLRWLLVGNSDFYKENHIEPIYRKVIEDKIEEFKLELFLIGNVESEL